MTRESTVVAGLLAGVLALTAIDGRSGAPDTIARGKYLVEVAANCGECHSPITATGEPDPRFHLAGHIAGSPIPSPTAFKALQGEGIAYARNLTPDVETGLGAWAFEDFRRVLKEGISKGGRPLNPYMPWQRYRRFLSDPDIEAVWVYLRSLSAVRNKVPESVPFTGPP
ncbi:MAG: c-type cytochrome [Candidatus Rokuibacteriota bacterium]